MSANFIPDAKKHLYVSLAKSGLRIVGYFFVCAIPMAAAHVAGALLILSEVLGIIEELV